MCFLNISLNSCEKKMQPGEISYACVLQFFRYKMDRKLYDLCHFGLEEPCYKWQHKYKLVSSQFVNA